jgi:sec-independent protein translocase protein TatB
MAFLLIIALVVLGPEKLPEAVRKFGKFYGEFKKMSSGFQSELRNVLDEPMREMRETADTLREVAQFDFEPNRVDGDTGQAAAAAPAVPVAAVSSTPTPAAEPAAVDASPASSPAANAEQSPGDAEQPPADGSTDGGATPA